MKPEVIMEMNPFPKKVSQKKPKFITNLVETYLSEHDGLTVSPEHLSELERITTTPPRDRSGSFSASARGTCERAQVFQYLDTPSTGRQIGPTLQSVFLDGTWRHIRWQMLLLEAGKAYDVSVQVEVPFYLESMRLRGSVDAIVDGIGFELKGTRAMRNAANSPFDAHTLQVHSYMVLTGNPNFVVLYEDKATQETIEHELSKNPKTEKKVLDELARLNESVEKKTLPQIKSGCSKQSAGEMSQEWWDCPYRSVCSSYDYADAETA